MSYARAAREAPPEFAKLSGAVIGAYNTVCRLEEVMRELCGSNVTHHASPPDPGVMATIGMAEAIERYNGRAQILIEIIKELIALKQTL